MQEKLLHLYQRLAAAFGPQQWWPAKTPFEVIVGAILTQGVSWTNVEKAMGNLRTAQVLDAHSLIQVPEEKLAQLVRPSGYYRIKAKKLQSFLAYLHSQYQGSLDQLFAQPLEKVRGELLAVWGVGPETADSILLYAGGHPSFVVDAYTIRIMGRLGITGPKVSYQELRAFFMDNLPTDAQMFNEYHAFFVSLGKDYCKKTRPRCEQCPVADMCHKVGVGEKEGMAGNGGG